ncbi:MAG: hypothetical protein AB7K24_25560 [Gemmataceae bacterium]
MNWLIDHGLLLLVGVVALGMALWGWATGTLLTKYGRVQQVASPGHFWMLIAGRALLGLVLIGWQIYLWC